MVTVKENAVIIGWIGLQKIIFISTSPSLCFIQPEDWMSSQVSLCSWSVQTFPRIWWLKHDKNWKTIRSLHAKRLDIYPIFNMHKSAETYTEQKMSIRVAGITACRREMCFKIPYIFRQLHTFSSMKGSASSVGSMIRSVLVALSPF